MSNRWTSRKFLTTLTAQVAALAVLFWPQQHDVIVQAAESVGALVVLVLASLGYVTAEASVDRARSGP